MTGTVLMALYAWPFFWLVDTKSPLWMTVAISMGLLIHSAMYAPQAAFFAELFGTRVRYSGASFGYQLASPLAGGIAPLVAAALLQWSDNKPWSVAAYIAGMCAVTWVAVFLAEETHLQKMTDTSNGVNTSLVAHPEGMTAIRRGLNDATPPVDFHKTTPSPGGKIGKGG